MEQFVELAKLFGLPVALLMALVWALVNEWIVPGAAYRRTLAERDEFKGLWADAVQWMGRATEVADKALTETDYGGSRLSAQRQVRRRPDDSR